MNDSSTHYHQWRTLLLGFALALVAFAVIFLMVGLVPASSFVSSVPTVLALAAAFIVGCCLTIYHHQTLVAWLLSCLLIPGAYLLCAQLLPDARQGWGALVYLFFTLCSFVAGNIGVMLGFVANRNGRRDT
jgi:hypothetical protein